MGFVKQIMEIGSGGNSIETTEAFNIRGNFDIDDLWGTLTFQLPYLLPDQKNVTEAGVVDITRLKKFDTVNLYFDELEKNIETIRPNDLVKVFTGFIETVKQVKSKSGFTYTITALGTLALADDRNLAFERKTGELQNLLVGQVNADRTLNTDDIGILQLAFGQQTNSIIPQVKFIDVDANSLFISVDGGKTLHDVLSRIRDKYAVIIHQSGDGAMNVFTPFFLLSAKGGELDVNAWEFILDENVFNLDYGDLTNNINSVVVLGFPPHFGVAVDPIAVQLNAGDQTPSKEHFNWIRFENRDLNSDEDCQKVARQKLLEIIRNFFITFQTKFDPRFQVGQPFTINDNDRFNDNQLWFIKRFEFVIDKTDTSCNITGFTHSLDFLPEDLVISPTGIADVDALEIREKLDEEVAVNWAESFV